MSKKYEQLAMDIIEKVGGKHNINDVYHCQTRLRFKLVDESIAKTKELEAMEGVAKVIMNAGWSYVKKKYKLNTTNFLFLCNC